MTNHTPGPWAVDPETGELTAQGDVILGIIYGAEDYPCIEEDIDDECEANANLIAAAPDLLNVAHFALKYVDKMWAVIDHAPGSVLAELSRKLRGAIEKANGEGEPTFYGQPLDCPDDNIVDWHTCPVCKTKGFCCECENINRYMAELTDLYSKVPLEELVKYPGEG